MRIALYHNLPSGGAKRAVYEWMRRLADAHQIDVYSLSGADPGFCDIRPYAQQHRIFNFEPHRLFDSPYGRLNQLQRWRDVGALIRLGQIVADEINDGNYDVVFAHTCMYTFIPTVLQFVQVPSVYYLHEPFGEMFTRKISRPYMRLNKWRKMVDRYDPFIKLYHRRLHQTYVQSVNRTNLLLANSQFTRDYMERAFHVETPVCHCGVDVESFRPLSDVRKQGHVLSVGEFSPRKGFDFLVESLAQIVPDRRPRLKLASNMILPEEKQYVQDLASQKGVTVQIMRNLDTETLAIEYNAAQLCVYAPVMEPFGLVPLEAMACGTPVIGVNEGGVQESVIHGRTGCLVDRDPQKFAEAVQRVAASPELIAAYGRNGREYILQSWTWDSSVERLEKYLTTTAGYREQAISIPSV